MLYPQRRCGGVLFRGGEQHDIALDPICPLQEEDPRGGKVGMKLKRTEIGHLITRRILKRRGFLASEHVLLVNSYRIYVP